MISDEDRLCRLMERARRGEELTLAFFGGSITQDSLATKHEYCYAYRVFQWFQKTFPSAVFHYVNAGIGGTDSYYGVSRAVTDALMYQPDFVVVDFSVNDAADAFYEETFEGVIRKILGWPSEPALVILNNVYYDTALNAEVFHNRVGDHYGVPHVSIRECSFYRDIREGRTRRSSISPDGLHPNDAGHALVAGEITALLSRFARESTGTEYGSWTMPEPVTDNAYENAKRLTIRECSPMLSGFRADTREKTGHLDHFKNGWIGRNPGDSITFHVTGTGIGVQFRRTIHRPARRAQLVLDGDESHPILLDGNFDEDWGDCLALTPVLVHGRNKEHEVTLRILPDAFSEAEPFYLLSLVVS